MMQSTPMATSSPLSPHFLHRPQGIPSKDTHKQIPQRITTASSAKLEVIANGINQEEILEGNRWRSTHRTLRAEIRGLRSEVAQLYHSVRIQDALEIPELQRLVDRFLMDVNSDKNEEEEPGIVVMEDLRQEWDSGITVEEQFRVPIISPVLHSDELHVKQKEGGLSTGRRLKKLNVHDYVHGALRESHMRMWLQNRGIAE